MSTRSEYFYNSLNTEADLSALIGQSEDADFDCKLWPERHDAQRGTLAKAACAFTNATGGVIIIGMDARRIKGEETDVVQSLSPVADANAVKATALSIIGESVDRGIEGVQAKAILCEKSDSKGYVIIHVPESEDAPRRSKVDRHFYVRISTGTQPMEMFQIADRFGRRPHPKLTVVLGSEQYNLANYGRPASRLVTISVRNDGRGLARFPCVRLKTPSQFRVARLVYDPQPVWPLHSLDGWDAIRGRSDDVIYPGEVFKVATAIQTTGSPLSGLHISSTVTFEAAELTVETLCDNMAPHQETFLFDKMVIEGE